MKKLRFSLVLCMVALFAVSMLFTACSTQDNNPDQIVDEIQAPPVMKRYTNNVEVDEWINENLETFRSMDRKALSNYSEGYQRALVSSLSPQRKYQLWSDKIENILEEEWSSVQLAHIQKLQSILSPATFANPSSAIQKWEMEARDAFTGEEFNRMFNTMENYRISEIETEQPVAVDPIPVPIAFCSCSKASDWCRQGSCKASVCITTLSGCGTLWAFSCDGTCQPNVVIGGGGVVVIGG